jgi:hypothetical protein
VELGVGQVPAGVAPSYGRGMKRLRLSPALFALICICFALPFATASCDNAKTSFTGVQLVTHTVPAGGHVAEGSDCNADISSCVENRGSFWATLALAMALCGLVFGLRGRERGPGWFATGGLVAMLAIAVEAVGSMAGVDFRVGYWLILLFFVCAMCLHGVYALRRRSAKYDEDARPAGLEPG